MGISVELWRCRIGGFHLSMRTNCIPSKSEDIKGSSDDIHSSKILSYTTCKACLRLCDTVSTVLLVVLTLQLILSGDVELNPGPLPGNKLNTKN